MTYEEIRRDKEIRTYVERADAALCALGYTEHNQAHVCRVAEEAGRILSLLGYSEHDVEIAKIAGYMHDIGNVVNRQDHCQSGAVMAFTLLRERGFDARDIADIMTAIGNHDEGAGTPVSAIAAALILADKSDVRRSRVRNTDHISFDIHDRVNYSVEKSTLSVNEEKTLLTLSLAIDTTIGSVSDYFEIFLERMLLCRRAAEFLGLQFRLVINEQVLM
jgi:metal-dependent HD superfamily phosphatase/phosphodiesterase